MLCNSLRDNFLLGYFFKYEFNSVIKFIIIFIFGYEYMKVIYFSYNIYIVNLVLPKLDCKTRKFKLKRHFVKRKHREGSYLICELRSA